MAWLEEVSLGVGFESSKANPFPANSLTLMYVEQDVSSWLLLQHACLPVMLPAMMVMDFICNCEP